MHVVFQEYKSSDAASLLENALKRIHVINGILDEDFKTAHIFLKKKILSKYCTTVQLR